MTKNYKKQYAAMFGLDARVALTIFGALSIITGATLYKVINNVNVISDIFELTEINKAVESYLLDTGINLPLYVESEPSRLNGKELIISSVSGWKGPYLNLNYTEKDDIVYFNTPQHTFNIAKYSDLEWTSTAPKKCVDGGNCYYWVNFAYRGEKDYRSYMKKIDMIIDGNDSQTTGKFRYRHWISPLLTMGSLQGPLVLGK